MNQIQNTLLKNWRKVPLWLRIGAVVVIAVIAALWAIPDGVVDVPTAKVGAGEFVIDLKETGKLKAERSVTVSAPPIRMNLQIIKLIEEGTVVEKGDTLIQFDTTEINQRIDDQQAEIDISYSNLKKTRASMESNIASQKMAVENSKASYRLAELRLEQMKFEADMRIEEGKLSLLQAELSLKQAEQNLIAQQQIDSAEVRSLELKIKQAENDLEKTLREKAKLTVTAPAPGLVVFKDTWRGGEMSKIQVGDTPWRGQSLLELPDLSVMQVETDVSEVDVAKIEKGMPVEVTLEAYPDPVFHGEIIDIAALARSDEGGSGGKVFDVVVRIEESDPLLKPGMSAQARIIVDRLQDKLWVPIEAVHQENKESFVWVKSGGDWKQKIVELGRRNDNFVIVKSGVEAGDILAMVDPTLADKASAGEEKALEESEESKGDRNGISSKTHRRRGRRRG